MNNKVKFILTYVAGIVTGTVLLFVVGFFMAKSQATSASNDDVVMFSLVVLYQVRSLRLCRCCLMEVH